MALTHVLAPFDLEDASVPALRYAADLVGDSGRVSVIHVMTTQSIEVPTALHETRDLEGAAERTAEEAVARVVADLGPGQIDTHIVFGDPVSEIVRKAAELSADAIVIEIKNRSRLGKLLLGSKAQSIILQAHCPVVCVPRD